MKKALNVTLGVVTAIGGFLDAGTVATSGAAGATFGLGLVWAVLIALLAIILLVEMVGRFTAVSKKTYAEAIREHFGFKFYLLPLTSELIAETLLLAAELGGMAIGLSLLTGISWHILVPVAGLIVFVMVWRASFSIIENLPALLGLITLSFTVGVFVGGGPRPQTWSTLWHPVVGNGEMASYLYLAAAILGATISPYLLYFYSSGAREDRWTIGSLGLNKVTAIVGMTFGGIGSLALMFLGAVELQPLHIAGTTLGEIGLALAKPFGWIGPLLFAAGLFATCLGAALEVALAVSYNIAQGLGWEWGQSKKPVEAPRFKLVSIAYVGLGLVLALVGGDPLQLALLASTIIALFLPISLAPFLVIMNDRHYLGKHTNGRLTNVATTAIIVMASLVAIVSIPLLLATGGG